MAAMISLMRTIPANLLSTFEHEAQLQAQALAVISNSEVMSDHLEAVSESLAYAYTLIQLESEAESAVHTLQLLCIRLLNCAASALKLGLAGYYQTAFAQLRDLLELVNLVDYFLIDPSQIGIWSWADSKLLRKTFSPDAVRKALQAHPEHEGQSRKPQYASYSHYASHATYDGFRLISPNNIPHAGCFFDPSRLQALLTELARRTAHATVTLSAVVAEFEHKTFAESRSFRQFIFRYQEKYMPNDTGATVTVGTSSIP